jgi:HEPN domain-containing protein
MKPPDVAWRNLVLQWLKKAASDLGAAEQLGEHGGRFREIVAFHCQQAAEKYLKALLVRHQIEFPKTHDITKLLDRVATVDAGLADSLRHADILTPFGVEVRYPSDAPEVLHGGETEVLDIARETRDMVMISLQPYLDAEEV